MVRMELYCSRTLEIVWREGERTQRQTGTPEQVCSSFCSSYLGEAATVQSQDVWVGTLQLPDDLEALVELGEDVHHGAGEQSVLRRLLELRQRGFISHLHFSSAERSSGIITYSVFFVSLQGSVHELHGNVFVFIQPLQHKLEEPAGTEAAF